MSVGECGVELPLGGRFVVVANLLLTRKATPSSEAATNELVALLDSWDGPGLVVVAGNCLDLSDAKNAPKACFDAHPRLAAALRAFGAGEQRRVLLIPGLADGAIADDERCRSELGKAIGAEVATSVDVVATTGSGIRRLRIECGHEHVTDHARSLVAQGYAGLIVGGGGHAALTNFGGGFFASCGRVGETRERRPTWLGVTAVSVPTRVVSWVEVEAGADLHVRLWLTRVDIPGASFLARAAMRRVEALDRPTRVATFPSDASWPEPDAPMERKTRVRRRAALLIAAAGALDLASAITPPLEQRLRTVLRLVPLAVPQTATLLVTLSGLGLLALARGVRRGQSRAHRIAVAFLLGSTILHLVKGVDVEEAGVAAVVAGYLLVHRDAFRTRTRTRAIRHGVRAALGSFVAMVVAVTAMFEVVTAAKHQRITVPQAALATLERLVGIQSVAVPDRLDDFATPALLAVGMGFLAWIAWQAVRPASSLRGTKDDVRRARLVVARYGAGTLDYFALRSDKEFFFSRDSLVAYAVHQGVCLVSPDPIGPTWERDAVWAEFRHFADGHGWNVAVFGADEEWLPLYRQSGMHDLYVGDEAVVDVTRFSLEGGRHKGLRQAANRIAKYGYTVTFHDPATADDELRGTVNAVMGMSRRGEVERGFSMTLGRLFDDDDTGLLLAVCRDESDRPVAFCQFVPAPGIEGYSLDLMRRDAGEHPNGLLDFVVVETIKHLAATGHRRLGLNFATMRAVLAGESGAGIATRIERWALRRMSGSMQIESLWKFNAKFDPEWQPRYAVYETAGNIVPVAFAIARAESFWELPVLGRFLIPPVPVERADAPS